MRRLRQAARGLLVVVFAAALLADWIAPASYEQQFRSEISAAPSAKHPLGTDDLGRDRLARLLYGGRVSLLLAPAATLLSLLIAAAIGGLAGYLPGWWDRLLLGLIDLFLCLPFLFLLLAVRAMLPLNVRPGISVSITFALLGVLGWAGPARVVRASIRSLMASDFLLQARASGCSGMRLLAVHLLPNLRPVLWAQFWISLPLFILSEANLSILGLGVSEPLPSLGSLLRELENLGAVREQPWMLAPALLLVLILGCFQVLLSREEYPV